MAPVDLLGLPTISSQVQEVIDQRAARQAAIHQGAFVVIQAPHHPCRGLALPDQLDVLLGLLCLEMCLVMTLLLSEQQTWHGQNNWLPSKGKRLQESKKWQLGCSICKWRGRILELIQDTSRCHLNSIRVILGDTPQTTRAPTPEPIRWINEWTPDCRW